MADLTVSEIMDRDVVTASPGDDVGAVIRLLRLVGGIVFLEPLKHLEQKLQKAFATKVEDMMTADVLTIRPDASVHEAARLISRSGHNRLPVTDDGRLVGVVTRVHALEALSREE